ncbi:hypothetical protein D3C81_2012230 [compost metagenome]
MGLTGKRAVRAVTSGEQDLCHLVQVLLNRVIVGQLRVRCLELVPLLRARGDKGFDGGGEPAKTEHGRAVEHLLLQSLTGSVL